MTMGALIKGTKKHPIIKVLVAIDVSGSVGTEDVRKFLGDIRWLLTKNDASVELLTFDDGITATYQLKDVHDLEDIKEVSGRGGTSYKAVLDYAIENKANDVYIFTDGWGDQQSLVAPPKSIDVWWICTQKEPMFPFGRRFNLDE